MSGRIEVYLLHIKNEYNIIVVKIWYSNLVDDLQILVVKLFVAVGGGGGFENLTGARILGYATGKTGVLVKVCILEESEQGKKAAGGAVPWKQFWQFLNNFDGVLGASSGRSELAWCGAVPRFCATTRARVFWTNWRRARCVFFLRAERKRISLEWPR